MSSYILWLGYISALKSMAIPYCLYLISPVTPWCGGGRWYYLLHRYYQFYTAPVETTTNTPHSAPQDADLWQDVAGADIYLKSPRMFLVFAWMKWHFTILCSADNFLTYCSSIMSKYKFVFFLWSPQFIAYVYQFPCWNDWIVRKSYISHTIVFCV